MWGRVKCVRVSLKLKVMNNALQTVSPGVWYDTVLAMYVGEGKMCMQK